MFDRSEVDVTWFATVPLGAAPAVSRRRRRRRRAVIGGVVVISVSPSASSFVILRASFSANLLLLCVLCFAFALPLLCSAPVNSPSTLDSVVRSHALTLPTARTPHTVHRTPQTAAAALRWMPYLRTCVIRNLALGARPPPRRRLHAAQ